MRIVFFGKEWRVLDALRNCLVEVVGVYLPEDDMMAKLRCPVCVKILMRISKKRMRKVHTYLPMAEYLRRKPLPIFKAKFGTEEFFRELSRLKPDLGVVARFEKIIPAEIFQIPKHGFINFHPSLLPKYRGPDPHHHIILNQEEISGTTWHQVIEKVDAGPIFAQRPFNVDPNESCTSYLEKSVAVACDLLPSILIDLSKNRLKIFPQNEALATKFKYATRDQLAELKRLKKLW